MRYSWMLLATAAVLAACQTDRPAPPAPEPMPAVDPVEPNLRVRLAHGACSGPPCPVGTAEDLASGAATTIYDFDLMPLGLPDEQRLQLTRSLFAEPYLVEGEIERRTGFLGIDRPVEVLVVTAVAGPA